MIRAAHFSFGLALAVALAGGATRAEEQAAGPRCALPAEIIAGDGSKLTLTGQRLKAKAPLTIVAIGGASTAGTAAGDGNEFGYPHELELALGRRHPGVAIHVVNMGVPRQTTEDMIARFDKDVVPANPTLVIWETGTVDAVRETDVDAFAAAVQDGIAALRQHNYDIMLVDMQYNPSTGSVIDFGPYLEALQHSADLADVSLFRRYEAMRYWSENGVFNFVDVPKDARVALARDVYRCLGETMAEAIDDAAE
ncbi:MAG TPA: GDSL-type esterase/lipase family protein [Stellaceae bacterium]|nr:GDSL-type esterase/lipase family protein [Stellaceae bacterium]